MHYGISIKLTILIWSICNIILAQNNLRYYLQVAEENNPYVKEFSLQSEIAGLEMQKISTQFRKPQWSITGDYLLAPYLNNNHRVLAITAAPDNRAVGYDVGISNGGLYSGLINTSVPLLSRKQMQPLVEQQQLFQRSLDNQQKLYLVDLRRRITSDYINAYLVKQEMDYTQQVQNQLSQQRELVRKLVDRSLMRITDLELLTLEISNQAYQFRALGIQYRQALQLLNTDAGIVDSTLVQLQPVDLEVEVERASSLFLDQYRLDSLGAVSDQLVFETRYLPQVSAFANGGLNAVDLNNIYRKVGVSAGLHLSWLLEDGEQKRINAQQNEIRKLNAKRKSEFIENQIKNSRRENQLVLNENRNNITLISEQMQGYEKLLNTYRQEMALGQLSVIEYLNVLRTYIDLGQQRNQLQIQLQLIINELNFWNQ